MFYIKFSAFIFFLSVSNLCLGAFSDMECLKANFSTEVGHKAFPFGLSKNNLKIQKQKCVLTISHTQYKYIKNKWIIDVCRTPIHIKSDSGSIDVIKRKNRCIKGDDTDYCSLLSKIEGIVQDDGLIFATGRKGDLQSDHGKIYCTSLLVDAHLGSGIVFDWTSQYANIFARKSYKQTPNIVPAKGTNSMELVPADF